MANIEDTVIKVQWINVGCTLERLLVTLTTQF